MKKEQFTAKDVDSMHLCGQEIAQRISPPAVIYLQGQLGAGKTTLVQGTMHYFGYAGIVSSPSYNLIHQYSAHGFDVAHLDLYRLDDPEELMMLGLADLLTPQSILWVEWPEKGHGFLPEADIIIDIQYQHAPNTGRVIQLNIVQ